MIDGLLVPVLSEEDRTMLGGLHPSFMGGEYLPNRRDGEVEIARIGVASTIWDEPVPPRAHDPHRV